MTNVRLVPKSEEARALLRPVDYIPAGALRAGAPNEAAATHLESADGAFTVGVWSADPYTEHVSSHEGYEYTYVLSGRITLTDTSGQTSSFGQGEAFTIEPGWSGEYRVDEPVLKHFVFYAP